MGIYYGVERSGEYLAHYGVLGMRWGVRRAKATGNDKQLRKHYLKANDKLVKLKRKENIGNNKADMLYGSGRKAKIAAKIGAAGLGIATGNYIGGKLLNKSIDSTNALISKNTDDWWEQVRKLRKEHPDWHDGITLSDPSLQKYHDKGDALTKEKLSKMNSAYYVDKAKKVAGIIGAGGMLAAGIYGAKAANSKWRASPKGHAKQVKKREAWENEMKNAFKGTKYANLPDTGPMIYKDFMQKKKRKRARLK